MLLLKLFFHLRAWCMMLFYKILYNSKLQIEKTLTFRKGFSLIIEKEGHIQIGRGCFFNNYCTLASVCSIQIGDYTIFGENVKIYDHNHCYADWAHTIKEQGYASAPVRIGSHCWIASNVIILKGVTIGDHCVIGAGCIIYKDIPSGTRLINQQTYLCLK